MTEPRPTLNLLPGRHKRLVSGHPWIFSNEVAMDAAAKSLPRGSLVTVAAADGRKLGTAFFNPHSLIAGRMLSSEPDVEIDAPFFEARLRSALALRESLYDRPFYRAVHTEADNLPGLIVDRFGDVLSVQINTAGMERCLDTLMEAFDAVFAPRAIVLRNDSGVRLLEGLEKYVRVAKGDVTPPIEIEEGGAHFFIDPLAGQKTGWFFDQRDNRTFMASLAKNKRVADFYSYAGGFAIRASLAGASEVRAFDSSETALEFARLAAERNGVSAICKFERAETFAELEKLAKVGERFDVVICDPPAFIKSRKDLNSGAKGYRKLARLAAAITAPSGFLFIASCSHHMEVAHFAEEVHRGIAAAGRSARVIRQSGASPDHPIHLFLPESAYLKAEVLQID